MGSWSLKSVFDWLLGSLNLSNLVTMRISAELQWTTPNYVSFIMLKSFYYIYKKIKTKINQLFTYLKCCFFKFLLEVLRANGPSHVFFFAMVIFLGSSYLLNIILAIVSMSYEQVCKEDQESDAQLAAAISVDYSINSTCQF